MARFEEIINRAAALGLPITEYEFRPTKDKPAPAPPFIVWTSTENQRGTDERNRIREISASIELYTDRKADHDLERRIEEEVLFDTEFAKYGVFIQNENMYQTAYDFKIIQKMKQKGEKENV